MRFLVICLVAGPGVLVLGERPASAQSAQTVNGPPPGDGVQHGGPVVRLRVGPAYLSATIGFGESPDRSYSGAAFAFDAEIGGSLTPNLTLSAELSGALAPSAAAGDGTTTAYGAAPTADLSTAGIGPSLTYTFDPSNAFIAINPAFTILRTSDPDHFFLARNWGDNHFGVGIGFVVGGQWPVSRGWRLGVAAEARYAAVSGTGDISTMSEYALLFSATYD